MKVLQLWQPWASLIAVEAKQVETRHWPAPESLIGHRVAIHACKRKIHPMVKLEPFERRLREADDAGTLLRVDGVLPLGFIIATARIKRCSRMTPESIAELEQRDPDERAFGFYGPGRYAWVIGGVERLAAPVEFTGRQGIPDIDDALIEAARPQEALL